MPTIREQKIAYRRFRRGYQIEDLAKDLKTSPKLLEKSWRQLGLIKTPKLNPLALPPQKEVFVPFWEPTPKPVKQIEYTWRDLERISHIIGWNHLRIKVYPHPDEVKQAIKNYDLVKVLTWSRFLALPENTEQVKIFKTIALTWAHWKAKAHRA